MSAVLEDAIYCFQQQFAGEQPRKQRLAKEAEEWLFSDDDRWPFSFLNICAALGLDPPSVRRALKRWRHSAKNLIRSLKKNATENPKGLTLPPPFFCGAPFA